MFVLVLVVVNYTCVYVAAISTLLVAAYQLVSLKVDPLGTRNVITAPRCIATCVVTWVLSASLLVGSATALPDDSFAIFNSVFFCSLLCTTCVCYVLVSYSVSRVLLGGDEWLQERKAAIKRVLRTFGLILAVSVICWIVPLTFWIVWAADRYNECLAYGSDLMIVVTRCANVLIYWWGIKEFRAVLSVCVSSRVDPAEIEA